MFFFFFFIFIMSVAVNEEMVEGKPSVKFIKDSNGLDVVMMRDSRGFSAQVTLNLVFSIIAGVSHGRIMHKLYPRIISIHILFN